MNKKWLINRGFRDGKSRCTDEKYFGEHYYLQGFRRGLLFVEDAYAQKLGELDRQLYRLGVEDGKNDFFRQEEAKHEPYMEGLIAGYLTWQIFVNDTEDHVLATQHRNSTLIDRTEVFVPLVTAECDKLRFSRQISCEEAHIPFAAPDLSDLEGVTEYELRAYPD
jgi:hypothetical protein